MTDFTHFQRLTSAPRSLLGASVEDFLRQLEGPTAIAVPGRDQSRRRAAVTLLHGNEPSGARAIRSWLLEHAEPATDALLVIVSVDAAREAPWFSHRMLRGRPDRNRCFGLAAGDPRAGSSDARLAGALLELLGERPCEAIVDLHNNTGRSPAYGVGTRLGTPQLALTSLFADRYMLSDLRLGTLMEALEDLTPSVTIECGRAGDPLADAVALAGLDRFLGRPSLDLDAEVHPEIGVLDAPLRVTLRPGARLAFGTRADADADLTLLDRVDRHNFELVPAGTTLGWVSTAGTLPLSAVGADDVDVASELFDVSGHEVLTRRAIVPIMMTLDPVVATTDCLFYAMQPLR